METIKKQNIKKVNWQLNKNNNITINIEGINNIIKNMINHKTVLYEDVEEVHKLLYILKMYGLSDIYEILKLTDYKLYYLSNYEDENITYYLINNSIIFGVKYIPNVNNKIKVKDYLEDYEDFITLELITKTIIEYVGYSIN